MLPLHKGAFVLQKSAPLHGPALRGKCRIATKGDSHCQWLLSKAKLRDCYKLEIRC